MTLRERVVEVSAFVGPGLEGNPAGVCLLDSPADPAEMQAVAADVGHAETAFLWPEEGAWRLRWFTPEVEVDLCGHATLAAAFVLSQNQLEPLTFQTRSGTLACRLEEDGRLTLDFPALMPEAAALPISLADTARAALWTGQSRDDWMAVLESAAAVEDYEPDMEAIQAAGKRGLIITAEAEQGPHRVVSRFFAPQCGVPEDHVTGSAHCALGPWWARRLGEDELFCRQASKRGGEILVRVIGDRVELSGRANPMA
jgi:PhzF family phenazine biosynthesis protein